MTTSIRALFRQAEATKKVEHPFAKYVNDKLQCTVCDLSISNERQWEAHIGTPTHRDAVQKYKVAQQRKAKRQLDTSTQAEAQGDHSKRLRREQSDSRSQLPSDFFDAPRQQSTNNPIEADRSKAETASDLDAEWAAFQKDIAKVQASTVVEATAVVTEQLTTNTHRGKAEDDEMDEIMDELQDQFEEQKTLESRVLKLKEMREKLRVKNIETSALRESGKLIRSNRDLTNTEDGVEQKETETEGDDEDDDEFDEYAAWRRKGI
ncbi:hypothetical protein V1508DRAFT_420236 [Lipomyces doorenjongii]|uniref:uncharacterized protein n=1 Tax=Lipomyces doorenjongii TaxID=383834 RepID=UPI0034CF23B8